MTTSPLTDQQLDAIEARRAALKNLGLPGGIWQAGPRDEKTVLPPEMAHVVEDVLRTEHWLLRSSVGVFGDERHAEFAAHAPEDVTVLVAEVRRLRARTLTESEYDAAWHAVEGAAGEEGADPGTVLHTVLDRLGIEWQAAAAPVV